MEINRKRYRRRINRSSNEFEFTRNVVCELLEKPESLNWRACELENNEKQSAKRHLEDVLK